MNVKFYYKRFYTYYKTDNSITGYIYFIDNLKL